MLLASGRMVASAKGHNRAEKACSFEKKRSDDRDNLVRKFHMKEHFTLGQSLDLNVWQNCNGLDFGARARRRLIAIFPFVWIDRKSASGLIADRG
jgi:hypothetical protein